VKYSELDSQVNSAAKRKTGYFPGTSKKVEIELITRRSVVQIQPPLPNKIKDRKDAESSSDPDRKVEETSKLHKI
jgi:hypothetical protein